MLLLIIGIFLVVLSYVASAAYHYTPIIGYGIGAVLIIVGLIMPSRREMMQKRMGNQQGMGAGRGQRWRNANMGQGANADPAAIVKARYARGEITKEQYDQMMNDVGS